jgi:hypothetical protein
VAGVERFLKLTLPLIARVVVFTVSLATALPVVVTGGTSWAPFKRTVIRTTCAWTGSATIASKNTITKTDITLTLRVFSLPVFITKPPYRKAFHEWLCDKR